MAKELTTTGETVEVVERYNKKSGELESVEANGVEIFKGDTLLARAAKLNKLSEVSQVALGMCLAEIKRTEAFKPEYEDFKSYYQSELKRSKGDVSKLLKVGQFMLDNKFPEETAPPYTLLYTSLSVFADKEPAYILAAAESNSVSEMLDNKREDDFEPHDHRPDSQNRYYKCYVCGKMERV